LSVTRPFDSSPALTINGPSSPRVYLAPLWRYGASNIGRTDVDTERKMKEGEKKEEREGKGKEGKGESEKGKEKVREKKKGMEGIKRRRREMKRGREWKGGRKIA